MIQLTAISKRPYQLVILIAAFLLLTASCSAANMASSEIILVGSTPGDATIRSMLSIDAVKNVDFIRWHLVLNESRKTFSLNAAYGVGKPNTPDFEGGGEKLVAEGTYSVSKERGSDVYILGSNKIAGPVALVKLNPDLFHVLSPGGKLMVGTGGWNYTLTRDGASGNSADLPRWTTTAPDYDSSSVIFAGRTPCGELARQYKLPAGDECHKLKWKLTLFRDPTTKLPTAYKLQRTLHRTNAIEGKWAIVVGTKTDPNAVIYRLDPERSDDALSFLVGDENVLFFLNKEDRLFAGNADFSYTLNRQEK